MDSSMVRFRVKLVPNLSSGGVFAETIYPEISLPTGSFGGALPLSMISIRAIIFVKKAGLLPTFINSHGTNEQPAIHRRQWPNFSGFRFANLDNPAVGVSRSEHHPGPLQIVPYLMDPEHQERDHKTNQWNPLKIKLFGLFLIIVGSLLYIFYNGTAAWITVSLGFLSVLSGGLIVFWRQ
jgi:hypothetical protein